MCTQFQASGKCSITDPTFEWFLQTVVQLMKLKLFLSVKVILAYFTHWVICVIPYGYSLLCCDTIVVF